MLEKLEEHQEKFSEFSELGTARTVEFFGEGISRATPLFNLFRGQREFIKKESGYLFGAPSRFAIEIGAGLGMIGEKAIVTRESLSLYPKETKTIKSPLGFNITFKVPGKSAMQDLTASFKKASEDFKEPLFETFNPKTAEGRTNIFWTAVTPLAPASLKAAKVKSITSADFPKPGTLSITEIAKSPSEFKFPRVSESGSKAPSIEGGFQPKDLTAGLVKGKELQSQLKPKAYEPLKDVSIYAPEEINVMSFGELARKYPDIAKGFMEETGQTGLNKDFFSELDTTKSKSKIKSIYDEMLREEANIKLESFKDIKFMEIAKEQVSKGTEQSIIKDFNPKFEKVIIEDIKTGKKAHFFVDKKGQAKLTFERGETKLSGFSELAFKDYAFKSEFKPLTDTRIAYATKTRGLTIPITAALSKTDTLAKYKSISSEAQARSVKLESIQVQNLGLTQELGRIQITRQEQDIAQVQIPKLELAQPQRIELFKTPKTSFINELKRPTTLRPPPFLLPPPLPGIDSPKKSRAAFDVFIRESSPKGKGKISFFKVSSKPLPKMKALNFGAQLVDESSARTFKIVRRGITLEKDALSFTRERKFRSPVAMSKLERISFVEKTKSLIDTIGEKKGITAKGLLELKKRRRKKGFSDFKVFKATESLLDKGLSLRNIRRGLF